MSVFLQLAAGALFSPTVHILLFRALRRRSLEANRREEQTRRAWIVQCACMPSNGRFAPDCNLKLEWLALPLLGDRVSLSTVPARLTKAACKNLSCFRNVMQNVLLASAHKQRCVIEN